MVETSRIDGKARKSSGLTVYSAVSSTMIDSAILKLKKTSSTNAGSGRIIIANSMMIRTGAAALPPCAPRPLIQAGSFMLLVIQFTP